MSSEPIEAVVIEPPNPAAVSVAYTRNETILHVLFLSMASLILLMSVLMRSEGQTAVFLPGTNSPMPETCTSRRLIGIDCPGCGMTRAFISISRGQFSRAWQFNPASFVVYAFVALQIPWHGLQIYRLRKKQRPIQWNWIYLTPIAVVVVLVLNWLWKLYHLL